MEKFRNLNKPIPRVDGIEKVTGAARYTDDFAVARMLYGKVLRSPYPHARIVNVDISRAEKLPGVRTVLSGKDNPEGRMGLIFDWSEPLKLDTSG